MISQIENYIYAEKDEEEHQEEMRNNRHDKLHTRKMAYGEIEEEEAERLQKEAYRTNAHPIWDYQSRLRTTTSAKNISIGKNGRTRLPRNERNDENMERMDS